MRSLPVNAWFGIAAACVLSCGYAQQPPAAAAAPPAAAPASISSSLGVVVFPSKNQTPAQQNTDESYCYGWAKTQSGIDPMAIKPAAVAPRQRRIPPPPARAPRAGGAVKGAAAGAAIGAIAGDTGQGAAIGAASGVMAGGASKRRAQKDAAAQQQQAQAASCAAGTGLHRPAEGDLQQDLCDLHAGQGLLGELAGGGTPVVRPAADSPAGVMRRGCSFRRLGNSRRAASAVRRINTGDQAMFAAGRWVFAAIGAAVLAACATTTQQAPASWDGLERRDVKGIDQVYVRPNFKFPHYKKVIIDPVQVSFSKNWDQNSGTVTYRAGWMPTTSRKSRMRSRSCCASASRVS